MELDWGGCGGNQGSVPGNRRSAGRQVSPLGPLCGSSEQDGLTDELALLVAFHYWASHNAACPRRVLGTWIDRGGHMSRPSAAEPQLPSSQSFPSPAQAKAVTLPPTPSGRKWQPANAWSDLARVRNYAVTLICDPVKSVRFSLGNGLCAVPRGVGRGTGLRNGTEAVPYRGDIINCLVSKAIERLAEMEADGLADNTELGCELTDLEAIRNSL
jgi:hypothetical protein